MDPRFDDRVTKPCRRFDKVRFGRGKSFNENSYSSLYVSVLLTKFQSESWFKSHPFIIWLDSRIKLKRWGRWEGKSFLFIDDILWTHSSLNDKHKITNILQFVYILP